MVVVPYDVEAVRQHFPSLKEGAAHFDGPGGSQVPDVVGDVVRTVLVGAIANRGSHDRGRSPRRRMSFVMRARRWPIFSVWSRPASCSAVR